MTFSLQSDQYISKENWNRFDDAVTHLTELYTSIMRGTALCGTRRANHSAK
jgi:hypothetical protein